MIQSLLRSTLKLIPTNRKKQFSKIDAGFLSWDFDAIDENGARLGRVDKDWAGLAREVCARMVHSFTKLRYVYFAWYGPTCLHNIANRFILPIIKV